MLLLAMSHWPRVRPSATRQYSCIHAVSVVTISSPFCGYSMHNTVITLFICDVKGRGFTVLVERSRISRLRKCPHDHCLSINAYLSHNTVANISKSFTYNMAAVKTIDIKRTYVTVTLCIRCSSSVFVCLSVCHKFMFHRNGCTDRAGSWHRSYPTLCLTEIRISLK